MCMNSGSYKLSVFALLERYIFVFSGLMLLRHTYMFTSSFTSIFSHWQKKNKVLLYNFFYLCVRWPCAKHFHIEPHVRVFGFHSRYKALESMLEETLKRSVEVREEKIASLESRLAESVNRNKELRKQLLEVC